MARVLFLLLLFTCAIHAQIPTLANYANTVDLSQTMSNGVDPSPTTFVVYYTVQPTSIDIGIVALVPPRGYAGFGIAPQGLMVPADVVIGWVDNLGAPHLVDYYSNGRFNPNAAVCTTGSGIAICPDSDRTSMGCHNDVVAKNVSRTGNYLVMEYNRPLGATDACDFEIFPNTPQYIIAAVGPVSTRDVYPYNSQYHSVRTNTTQQLTFIQVVTTGVATTANPTTGAPNMTTAVPTTAVPTTAVPTTGFSTTGAIPMAPVLTGYANDMDLTPYMTNGFFPTGEYYHLYYTIQRPNIKIGIVALTPDGGWAGFGFSSNGYMVSGTALPNDAAIAWVAPNSTAFVTDFALFDRFPPDETKCLNGNGTSCPDTSQAGCADDFFGITGSRQNGYLKVEFSRPLAASDKCDRPINPGIAQYVIFSVGPIANSFPWPYKVQFHSARTNITQQITFMESATSSTVAPSTATSVATSSQPCQVGALNCPCTTGGACNTGLVCSANLICVESAAVSMVASLVLTFIALMLIL